MEKSEGHQVKLVLEKIGGFTGPAGREVTEIDLARLPPDQAAAIAQELAAVPPEAWNQQYLSAHPKPWDFRHVLRQVDGAVSQSIEFQLHQGPAALTRLAEKIAAAKASG
ncbi:MAG TPA: protealysin inhibitor emfourin [Candidatus Didemnitutus sp.]|nr:protealysin inhibitor emfourin [Candidatus Didemnitutus sp.]